MNSHVSIGHESAFEVIRSGGDLAEFMTRLLSTRACLPDVLGAAIGALLACLQAACANGAVIDFEGMFPAEMRERSMSRMHVDLLQAMNSNDSKAQGEQLSFLVTAIHQLREKGFTWSIPVEPCGPNAIAIVSMPERVTSVSFQRDPVSLEIVGSTQIESDAVRL